MKNVSDKTAIERILKAIAQDDELIRQFAMVVGVEKRTFDKWIDTFNVPEPAPKNVFVSCRYGALGRNAVSIFYAVHTTREQAQEQIDKLNEQYGKVGFVIVEAPLNP